MPSIDQLIKERETNKPKLNERQFVLKEIYELYLKDESHRKVANWKRFCSWCRTNKKGKESLNEFKKSKQFIKPISAKLLAIRFSHLKVSDLYYMLSVAKDKKNRGENVGGFLLGSIKAQNLTK